MDENNSDKISVIVTMYNREYQIKKCLDSILNQSIEPHEVIVVDDASTDRSKQIVQSYNNHEEKIRLVVHDKNLGQNAALNSGYANTKGSIITFLDSDDEWDKEYLEQLKKIFEKNKEVDYIYSKVNLVNPIDISYLSGKDAQHKFYKMAFLASPGNLAIRRVTANSIFPLPKLGIYRRINQDSYMNRGLVTYGKGYYLKKITLKKNVVSNSMSSSGGTQADVLKSWYLYYTDIENDVIKFVSKKQVIFQKTFLSVLALSFDQIKFSLIIYKLARRKAKVFGFSSVHYHVIYLESLIYFINNVIMNLIETSQIQYNRLKIYLKNYWKNL